MNYQDAAEKIRTTLATRLHPESEWLEYLICEAMDMMKSGKRGMSIPAHMSRSGIVDFITFPKAA